MKKQVTLGYVVRNSGDKRPFGLIFIGENDRPTGLSGASKLLIATGANVAAQPAKEFTSDPFNVSGQFLEKLGINPADVPVGNRMDVRELGLTGEDVFGMSVDIQTVEKTSPFYAGQEPVKTPADANGTQRVITSGGTPIYRSKTIVPVEDKKNEFLQFDAAPAI